MLEFAPQPRDPLRAGGRNRAQSPITSLSPRTMLNKRISPGQHPSTSTQKRATSLHLSPTRGSTAGGPRGVVGGHVGGVGHGPFSRGVGGAVRVDHHARSSLPNGVVPPTNGTNTVPRRPVNKVVGPHHHNSSSGSSINASVNASVRNSRGSIDGGPLRSPAPGVGAPVGSGAAAVGSSVKNPFGTGSRPARTGGKVPSGGTTPAEQPTRATAGAPRCTTPPGGAPVPTTSATSASNPLVRLSAPRSPPIVPTAIPSAVAGPPPPLGTTGAPSSSQYHQHPTTQSAVPPAVIENQTSGAPAQHPGAPAQQHLQTARKISSSNPVFPSAYAPPQAQYFVRDISAREAQKLYGDRLTDIADAECIIMSNTPAIDHGGRVEDHHATSSTGGPRWSNGADAGPHDMLRSSSQVSVSSTGSDVKHRLLQVLPLNNGKAGATALGAGGGPGASGHQQAASQHGAGQHTFGGGGRDPGNKLRGQVGVNPQMISSSPRKVGTRRR